MNWLSRISKPKSKQIIFTKKTLTINGIKSSTSTKALILQEEANNSLHPEYNLKEQKIIADFFTLATMTKKYCESVIQKSKGSFLTFCQHPNFKKFWKKINQKYDPDWFYNIEILKKDKRLIENMKVLLKKVVENPTEPFEFGNEKIEAVVSLDKSLKKLEDMVLITPRSHKEQLRQNFYKFK